MRLKGKTATEAEERTPVAENWIYYPDVQSGSTKLW